MICRCRKPLCFKAVSRQKWAPLRSLRKWALARSSLEIEKTSVGAVLFDGRLGAKKRKAGSGDKTLGKARHGKCMLSILNESCEPKWLSSGGLCAGVLEALILLVEAS